MYLIFCSDLTQLENEVFLSSDVLQRAKELFSFRKIQYLSKRIGLIYFLNRKLKAEKRFIFNDKKGIKPFIENQNVCFSLSDSARLNVIAAGRSELGIDLELVKKRVNLSLLCSKVLSESEKKCFESASNQELYFCRQWTVREAVLKYFGFGIDKLSEISLDVNSGRILAGQSLAGQNSDSLGDLKLVNTCFNYHGRLFALSFMSSEELEAAFYLSKRGIFIPISKDRILSSAVFYTIESVSNL